MIDSHLTSKSLPKGTMRCTQLTPFQRLKYKSPPSNCPSSTETTKALHHFTLYTKIEKSTSVASEAFIGINDLSAQHLPKLINSVPGQKVIDWKAAAGDALDTAKDPANLVSSNIGDIQTYIPELGRLLKSLAEDLKANKEALISRLDEVDWTDPKSIVAGLRPILDHLKPILDFIKAHPWVLLPLLIPAFEVFLVILGFGAEGVVAGK